MNQGHGTFCDAHDQAGPAIEEPRAARGLAVGDLFNNGNMDVVIGNLDGLPTILKNPGIPGRHWISLELAGTKSNRLAIGARLKIVAGGMTQTEEIHSGGSCLSQNDLRVHFGLGSAGKADRVEIHWPSGATDVLKDLDVDKFYSVLEGKGIVPFRGDPALTNQGALSPLATPEDSNRGNRRRWLVPPTSTPITRPSRWQPQTLITFFSRPDPSSQGVTQSQGVSIL